jgi:outer membrane protein assembly factor BamB
VFIGSCNGIFRALELTTGRVRWETKVSPDAVQYFFHGDPYVAGDIIVAGADRATGASIHAFDRSTGKELWRHAAGRGVNGPIAGTTTHAYAISVEGRLLSLAVDSGTVSWDVPLKGPGFEGPAVANRVLAGTVDGVLYGLNVLTGREEWRRDLGSPVTTTPHATASDAYVGTADGSMHRVDTRSGTVLSSRKLDPSLKPISVPVRTADSLLVLLTDHEANYRMLVSVDLALQRDLWRVSADKAWSTSRVFVWSDVVVLGTSSGDVVAYCKNTGAKSWTRSVNGPVRSVGGAADTLLVGTRTGGLYAMRVPRGCDAR